MPKHNFNNTTPVAPAGKKNVIWQQSGDQASAHYDNLDPRLVAAEGTLADILANFCVYVDACGPLACPPGESCCPTANACITPECFTSASHLGFCHWEVSGQCGNFGEGGPDCGPIDIVCDAGEGCDDICRENWCSTNSGCDEGQCGSACYEFGYDNGYSLGYFDGFADGYDQGYLDGYDDGYADAMNDFCTACPTCRLCL